MSGSGQITLPNVGMSWREDLNEVRFEIAGNPHTITIVSYDTAREILDCLMVLFGKHELTLRYPEVSHRR